MTIREYSENSRDKDGSDDERGGIETSLAVSVLSLSLVHLPSTVVTASTHTETHADDGREDHKHDTDARTYEKSCLIADPLQKKGIHNQCLPSQSRFWDIVVFWHTVMSLPVVAGPHFLAGTSMHTQTRTHRKRKKKTQNKVSMTAKALTGGRIPISTVRREVKATSTVKEENKR